MTVKQFVSLIEEIAEENGYSCTTDVGEGDSWGRGMATKGCTIFAGDYYDEERSKKDFDSDKSILMEIRKRLWEEYLIVANRPIANGYWKDGCILNINFKNNRHHWTMAGQKAYQIMEIDANCVDDEDVASHYYPAYNTFDVFASYEAACIDADILHAASGRYHRIDEIELDDENNWVFIDMIHKRPKL